GDTGCDHAAIAVPDQHDIAQILELQHAEHVSDMRFEIDIGRGKMRALAKPGIARRINVVTGGAQDRPHLLPRPGRRPGAMRNNDGSHRPSPDTSALSGLSLLLSSSRPGNATNNRTPELPHARPRANETKNRTMRKC